MWRYIDPSGDMQASPRGRDPHQLGRQGRRGAAGLAGGALGSSCLEAVGGKVSLSPAGARVARVTTRVAGWLACAAAPLLVKAPWEAARAAASLRSPPAPCPAGSLACVSCCLLWRCVGVPPRCARDALTLAASAPPPPCACRAPSPQRTCCLGTRPGTCTTWNCSSAARWARQRGPPRLACCAEGGAPRATPRLVLHAAHWRARLLLLQRLDPDSLTPCAAGGPGKACSAAPSAAAPATPAGTHPPRRSPARPAEPQGVAAQPAHA